MTLSGGLTLQRIFHLSTLPYKDLQHEKFPIYGNSQIVLMCGQFNSA